MRDAKPKFIDRYGVIVMLDFTSSTTRPAPSARPLLSGQTIAKAKTWSPRDRAERAVDGCSAILLSIPQLRRRQRSLAHPRR
jgi:hypothetical protein